MPTLLLALGEMLLLCSGAHVAAAPAASPAPPWPGPAPKGGWALQRAALPKLTITADNCIDMFGAGISGGGTNGSKALFDEQQAAGDPAAGRGEIA